MCRQRHVQILAVEFHRHDLLLVGEIASSNDVALAGTKHGYGSLAVLSPRITDGFRTLGHKMGKMLVGIELGCIAWLACLAVHLHQGILPPSPGRLSVVGQNKVPVIVLVTSVAEIVLEEKERMFACFPVHIAIAAFALAHHQSVVGIAATQFRQIVSAFPLRADACDILLQGFVVKDFFHIVEAVGVDGAKP